jgi:hypothetical protein
MLRHLLVTGAIVLSAPAVAQTQTPAADPPAPQAGPPSATDAPAAPETQTSPQPDSSTPTNATGTNSTTTAAQQSPTDIIATEFPGYDADKSGDLNKAEFGKWMLALRAKSPQAGEKKSQAELDKWAGTAFTQADTDKNKKVSQAELGAFLTASK